VFALGRYEEALKLFQNTLEMRQRLSRVKMTAMS